MKYDVFISYSRKDYQDEQRNVIPGNVVSVIKETFHQHGITYWMDEEGDLTGKKFAQVIAGKIRESIVFLFVCTRNSVNSEWVDRELSVAVERRKRIIPFVCDDSYKDDRVIMFTASLDRIEFFAYSEKELERLVAAIEKAKKELKQKIQESERQKQAEEKKRKREELRRMADLERELRDTKSQKIQIAEKPATRRFHIAYILSILSILTFFGVSQMWNVKERQRLEPDQGSKQELKAMRQAEVKEELAVNGVVFNMILVDGGTFQMGSKMGERDEKPVHSVTVGDFYIGETEVTQELWKAVMGSNPSKFEGIMCPVENVSWEDICGEDGKGTAPYCFLYKLNQLTGMIFRLPTEAEWEFAARGGNKSQNYAYSGSNILDDVAWYVDNSDNTTHDVAAQLPNELGIYDMSGNVWEWCQDRYDLKYYSISPANNPAGPSSGSSHVFRGGSVASINKYCSVANRGNISPTSKSNILGFRLAK